MLIDPALLLGFLALSAVMSATPGPSVILATGRAITRGRGEATWIILGNATGGLTLLALVVAGLGAVVATSATVFMVVKIAGAIYLCWLGVRAIISASCEAPADVTGTPTYETGATRSRLLRQGFLVGASNPKSIVTLMAVLPQFVDPAHGNVAVQMALIGLAGALVQLMIELSWVLAAASLRSWFRRRPNRVRALQGAGGLAMIGMAGRLALQRPT